MKRRANESGQRLRRMASLLFAFAALAERVAVAPWPIRFIVFVILRRAEAIAWAFATPSPTRVMPGDICPPGTDGPATTRLDVEGPAEAFRLACSFRMLALIVTAWAEQFSDCAPPAAGWNASGPLAGALILICVPAPRVLDTS